MLRSWSRWTEIILGADPEPKKWSCGWVFGFLAHLIYVKITGTSLSFMIVSTRILSEKDFNFNLSTGTGTYSFYRELITCLGPEKKKKSSAQQHLFIDYLQMKVFVLNEKCIWPMDPTV